MAVPLSKPAQPIVLAQARLHEVARHRHNRHQCVVLRVVKEAEVGWWSVC